MSHTLDQAKAMAAKHGVQCSRCIHVTKNPEWVGNQPLCAPCAKNARGMGYETTNSPVGGNTNEKSVNVLKGRPAVAESAKSNTASRGNCTCYGCEGEPLVWVWKGQSFQSRNGFIIAKIAAWYCQKCGGSYGGTKPTNGKRIRQSSKPLMSPWEQEKFDLLHAEAGQHSAILRAQAVRFRLGNGAWYKPDIYVSDWPNDKHGWKPTAWEVKGGKKMKGVAKGILALKVAASTWPEIRFILTWKENGVWKEQEVIP